VAESPRLAVVVTDRLGRPLRLRGLAGWLLQIAPSTARGEVAIAIVSDRQMRALNRTYRKKDRTTDVLSFPAEPARPASGRQPSVRLGDIVISADTARRQARDGGHGYAAELKILALHGLLHLLGYDHDSPSDRGRMSRLERRLRTRGGLREGLIERGRAAAAGRARGARS
jgi:probable rRNA maturation factor